LEVIGSLESILEVIDSLVSELVIHWFLWVRSSFVKFSWFRISYSSLLLSF
jgi:hypothetical protein